MVAAPRISIVAIDSAVSPTAGAGSVSVISIR
jgi:hypothetical protein